MRIKHKQVSTLSPIRLSLSLVVEHPSAVQDLTFISQTFAGLLMWRSLYDETTGLSLLALAITVIFGPESSGALDLIVQSQIRYPSGLPCTASHRTK
jgi:hypothetical protein